MKYVYVFLTRTGTMVANIIGKITGDRFAHASISQELHQIGLGKYLLLLFQNLQCQSLQVLYHHGGKLKCFPVLYPGEQNPPAKAGGFCSFTPARRLPAVAVIFSLTRE